jgi:hypothetical protein
MYRNFNLFPFQPLGKDSYLKSPPIDQFGLVLRSTYSMLIAIALKPFLTSAVKVLTWLLATTTKICTNAWSRQDRSLSPSYQKKILSLPQKYKMHHTKLQVTSLTFVFWDYCRLYVYTLSAPLIFKAIAFVRWVVTHSIPDSNFHGHWPDVIIQQHFLWYLIMSV